MRDFDFLFGTWNIHNRKLRDTIDPACDEWVEFATQSAAEPIFGGLGNVDRIWADDFEGFTLRQYDPAEDVWRIWWASTRNPGHLDPPVVGRWSGGRGVFECDDVLGGHPVRVRFTWTHDGPDKARWEQAFSYDAGASWRTNWIMEFTRSVSGIAQDEAARRFGPAWETRR
ncbi:hypothetical protein ACFFX1_38430 [Dactylosporangium sucinum]|uniref:DUF1579 domain-containing protein n=1 Tax=Dactylosporangium sucinum TaxID=1424081 RepID=A0A917WPI2_9ACTN|nr:hypothetical protein [Dactylosporangium sucinum]GGM18922.1 hypothetical protein GCM10007977_020240 [Dactylosporangium sucinum]